MFTEAIEQELILDLLGEIGGRHVLEIGCGDGALACALALRGAEVVGLDPNPAMLSAARSRAAEDGIVPTFVEGRIERLPFPDASFDTVIAVTVLCFVRDATGAVREMARVLRPGGQIVVGELGRWSVWAAFRRVRGWFGSPTWRAARFHTANGLRALFERNGLSLSVVRGAVYYPPIGVFARVLAPVDRWPARIGSFGAAFIAAAGRKEPKK
jgi:SAM-dependent methyltransferase